MEVAVVLLQREALLEEMAQPDLDKRLVITPLLDATKQVSAGSVDLRLGSGFIEIHRHQANALDPSAGDDAAQSVAEHRIDVPMGESVLLHPGQFLLGATFEFLQMPNHLAGQVLGRSSWGRLGLIVATAVTVQPGYKGCLTLELQNLGSVPIRLFTGLRIAQLMIWRTAGTTESPYSGEAKYDAPLGPESSRIGWERDEVDRLETIGLQLQGRSQAAPVGPVPTS